MLEKQELFQRMSHSATLLQGNLDRLSEIDARFGDGDHGITMGKISELILGHVVTGQEKSIRDFFQDLGNAIINVKGGSAGPLYGTMIAGFGECLTGEEEAVDGGTLKAMFASALAEMEDITKAKIGDKTMMDALIPAVKAAESASDTVEEIFQEAATAAAEGCKASENFVSKFGRARSYKEQTLGTPDAGAVSTALFFEGLAQA